MRGDSPPVNVFQSPVMVVPADLPPVGMWAVYELLEPGRVAHARYVGTVLRIEGETAEALMMRATQKVREEG